MGNHNGLTKTKILITGMFFISYLILLKLFNKFKSKKVVIKIAISLFVSVELVMNAYSCLVLQAYAPREYIYN